MRAELAQRQGSAGISAEQMAALKEEAAMKAREQVILVILVIFLLFFCSCSFPAGYRFQSRP